MATRRFWLRWSLIAVGATLLIVGAGSWLVGNRLLASRPSRVGPPPVGSGLEAVLFRTPAGVVLSGWFGRGTPGRGAALLLHALGGDRRQMWPRAAWLLSRGVGVLLFDLPAHGESGGDRVTFGHREGEAAATALAFLRKHLPGEKVIAIGASLGGAACLLGRGPLPVDALVLEAVYPSITKAVTNRLTSRLGWLGRLGVPLLTLQLPLRLGIETDQLRPESAIARVTCPVLVMGGALDQRTTREDTARLHAAAREPKTLWIVEGAGHVDLCRHAGPEYYRRITPLVSGLQER